MSNRVVAEKRARRLARERHIHARMSGRSRRDRVSQHLAFVLSLALVHVAASARRQTARQIAAVGEIQVETLESREVAARRVAAQILTQTLRGKVGDDAARRT